MLKRSCNNDSNAFMNGFPKHDQIRVSSSVKPRDHLSPHNFAHLKAFDKTRDFSPLTGLYISTEAGCAEAQLPLVNRVFSMLRMHLKDNVDASYTEKRNCPSTMTNFAKKKSSAGHMNSFNKDHDRSAIVYDSETKATPQAQLRSALPSLSNIIAKCKKRKRILARYNLPLDTPEPSIREDASRKIRGRVLVLPTAPHNAKKYFRDTNGSTKHLRPKRRNSIDINKMNESSHHINDRGILPTADDRYFRETVVDIQKNKPIAKNPLLKKNKVLSKRYKSPLIVTTSLLPSL